MNTVPELEVKKIPVSANRTDYSCDGRVYTLLGSSLWWVEHGSSLVALDWYPGEGEPEEAIRKFATEGWKSLSVTRLINEIEG